MQSPFTALNTMHKVRSQWGWHLVNVSKRGAGGAAADPMSAAQRNVAEATRGMGGGGRRAKKSPRKAKKRRK